MQQVRDTRQRLKHAFLTAAVAVAFTATAGGTASAQTPTYVDAKKPGETVKLYSAPDKKSRVIDAPTLPLLVQGASQHDFYPVKVDGKPYWADGLEVKVVRSAQARCSQSAGIQAAGTLGAAANRCQ
ncbi:hypothetical protein [Paraburkholderia dioscoreae]|uniref:Uncharacterized protein n=1 Tax=Paraburkholderia dioscoreae TaxID=2604047 RepID=A0A5Q4Z3Q8_9BURK|nr:hypothetical protein [Paraburkholderia dioscoreae]VVD34106.1 conserved exported protein of unknown function [Paraburkholderia dioscoreae]